MSSSKLDSSHSLAEVTTEPNSEVDTPTPQPLVSKHSLLRSESSINKNHKSQSMHSLSNHANQKPSLSTSKLSQSATHLSKVSLERPHTAQRHASSQEKITSIHASSHASVHEEPTAATSQPHLSHSAHDIQTTQDDEEHDVRKSVASLVRTSRPHSPENVKASRPQSPLGSAQIRPAGSNQSPIGSIQLVNLPSSTSIVSQHVVVEQVTPEPEQIVIQAPVIEIKAKSKELLASREQISIKAASKEQLASKAVSKEQLASKKNSKEQLNKKEIEVIEVVEVKPEVIAPAKVIQEELSISHMDDAVLESANFDEKKENTDFNEFMDEDSDSEKAPKARIATAKLERTPVVKSTITSKDALNTKKQAKPRKSVDEKTQAVKEPKPESKTFVTPAPLKKVISSGTEKIRAQSSTGSHRTSSGGFKPKLPSSLIKRPSTAAPPKAIVEKVARPETAPVVVQKVTHASDAQFTDIVFSLRTEIRTLRKDLRVKNNNLQQGQTREVDFQNEIDTLKASYSDTVEAHSRLYVDREKRSTLILVASLKREVRRLKFQRNSLSDPTLEVQFYPFLPRSSFGAGPRHPPVGIMGNCAKKSNDYFVMNPPPSSGTHEEGGHRHWWGEGEEKDDGVRIVESRKPVEVAKEIMLGNRVTVVVDEKKHHGTVKYVGAFDGAPNSGAWCGIRLDAPVGRHNGVVLGKRYFPCDDNHGFFAKVGHVALL